MRSRGGLGSRFPEREGVYGERRRDEGILASCFCLKRRLSRWIRLARTIESAGRLGGNWSVVNTDVEGRHARSSRRTRQATSTYNHM